MNLLNARVHAGFFNTTSTTTFPTHAPHVLPADPHTRALVRIWVDHVNKQIVPAFMRTVMAQEPAAQRLGGVSDLVKQFG